MEVLGRGSLILALALAVYAMAGGLHGALTRDRRVIASAERALVACFAAVVVASVVLWWALLTHDFRFQVVADETSRHLPTPYLFTAFWASQPGSLLLWMLVLGGYSTLVVRTLRKRNRELAPWVTAILGGIASFFALALVVAASPFATVPGGAPPDGNGLNSSLQNPYMAIHPPMLYLGYVGFSIPFAFAMAALWAGRTDASWITSARRWTLSAWLFLAVGMLLGAHWAYVEIGWGGYWGWDPVENAALVPWLVGTAFLHSVIVQEKKGMLKVWNVSLSAATFALCILGTFFTRSGVLSSIHSFVQSQVGPWLLVFLAIVIAFSVITITTHLPLLRAEHRIESVLSREASFLFNNLLFVAFAFAILWGVLFPKISQAVRGETFSVSSPYYDFFAVVFGLPLLLLAGLGPVIAWRRASPRSVWRAFIWPFLSAAAMAGLLLLLGYGTSIPGVVAVSLCLFVVVTVGLELVRGTRARRALQPGTGWLRALTGLVGRNRRRYGGYVVHLAVAVGVVGIVGSTAYTTVDHLSLRQGQTARVHGYDLTLRGVRTVQLQNGVEKQAVLGVAQNGHSIGTLSPGVRRYYLEGPSKEVDIRSSLTTGEDLYTIFDGAGGGVVHLKVLVNPLVNLLWLAGVILVAGTLIAIWPDPREVRRLVRRTASEPYAAELQ